MEKIVQQRAVFRRQMTMLVNEVKSILEDKQPERDRINSDIQQMDEVRSKITEKDDQILFKLCEMSDSEDQLGDELMSIKNYEDKYRMCRLSAMKFLETPVGSNSEIDVKHVTKDKGRSMKLPDIELQKFDGDLRNWISFWSQFSKINEDSSLHPNDKFQYLLQSLQPGTEAREIVEGYPLSGDNYPLAVSALKIRFGNEDLLLQVYVRELLKLVVTNVTSDNKIPFQTLYIKLESHLRALATLKLESADPATWLYPLVESSLNEEILLAWQRSPLSSKDGRNETPMKTRLDYLMEFLQAEIQIRQRLELAQTGFQDVRVSNNKQGDHKVIKKNNTSVPTAAVLFNGQDNGCIFCGNKHESEKCGKAKSMTMEKQRKKVRENKACFTCLKKSHISKKCKAFVVCYVCPKKHLTVMCLELNVNSTSESRSDDIEQHQPIISQQQPTTTAGQTNVACISSVLMKTLRVNLKSMNSKRIVTARLLFDEGSQRSYISSDTVTKIESQPVSTEVTRNVLFDGSVTQLQNVNKHDVMLYSLDGMHHVSLILRERNKLGGSIPRVPNGPWISELKMKGIILTDTDKSLVSSGDIDIVIGSDYWMQIVTGKLIKLPCGLGAAETILGWTLSGPVPTARDSMGNEKISMLITEQDICKLWNLDVIGIQDPINKKTEQEEDFEARRIFQSTTTRNEDGRYCVRLPWIHWQQQLPSNRVIAERRLLSTTKKLEQNDKYNNYDNVFNSWVQEGFIEEVTNDQDCSECHYLPHRPVFKDSLTTPVRPVFDASCKSGRTPSLNDCLYKGPNCIELLTSILMGFRVGKIGYVADIRKAFQMIEVQREDRDYLRFLWWEKKGEVMKVYRHQRVVFGVNCSPFLLSAVLEKHLKSIQNEAEIARKLLKSMYVDNLVGSVDTYKEYEHFKKPAVCIMNEAKMDLRQWECTVEDDSRTDPPDEESGMDSSKMPQSTTVLGVTWNKIADTLFIEQIHGDLPDTGLTKRIILSTMSKVFDPIGHTCPALITPKLLLQKSWERKIGWDKELPEDMVKSFRLWYDEIHYLASIHLHRMCILNNYQNLQLHTFCDASFEAYAAVVFLRSEKQGDVMLQLMQAKSRITPLKKGTIPRLELLSCLIGCRLAHAVKEALGLHEIRNVMWSDSTTAISWINMNDDWGSFVGNRVRQILELTTAEQWRHLPGKLNPADLPSRGCTPKELMASRWWEGPTWLKESEDTWPSAEFSVNEEEIASERRKTSSAMHIGTNSSWFQPKFSTYLKNVKLMAWIRRFLSNCKVTTEVRKRTTYITFQEIRFAEKDVLRMIQMQAFEGMPNFKGLQVVKMEDGIYHVKTAIIQRHDEHEFLWPILLPKKHVLVSQLIMEAHLIYGHARTQFLMGKLRERFWIISSRKTIRSVIGQCLTCRRFDAQNVQVPMAPLPEKRVMDGEVFATTGVDLGGPLYLKDGKKVWFIIFTCAVYRCIHLDLITSINTISFIQALERFISLFGRPTTLYSDNGTSFVAANNLFQSLKCKDIEVQSHCKRIQWIFNPPTASWWGGFWERLIKSIKDQLRRMLRNAKLDFEELRTCLAAVEYTINERPLTTVCEDPNDFHPLTPADFLRSTKGATFPEGRHIRATDLRGQYKKLKAKRAELQARFRKEYLALLVRRKSKNHGTIHVGQLVMVGADNKKRFEWPLGRIKELIPGKDDIVRVAKVRTAHGVLLRPVQRLYPLEMSEMDEPPSSVAAKEISKREKSAVTDDGSMQMSKYGRKIAKPHRYDSWNY